MRGLLAVVAVLLISPRPTGQDTSADDIAIYKAVIEHTIRPEVIRFDKGAGIEKPTILVVDRTLAICRPGERWPIPHGCLSLGNIQFFEKPFRNGTMIFDGLVTDSVRGELAKSLLSRNDQNYPFPSLGIADFFLAAPEKIDATLKSIPGVSKGFASFSRPAYFDARSQGYVLGNRKLSDQSQALIYATYFCGGACGYGWFFLLERRGGDWHVQSRYMLWIA
jgi:hypothetical protein